MRRKVYGAYDDDQIVATRREILQFGFQARDVNYIALDNSCLLQSKFVQYINGNICEL